MAANLYYTMILPTSKQIIDRLLVYDGIVLGGTNAQNIIGLSNDFFVTRILSKVAESIPTLQVGYKPMTTTRTLWLITKEPNDNAFKLLQ